MRIRHQVSRRAVQRPPLLSKSPADLHQGLTCFNISLWYMSNIAAFWIYLQHCRCIQEHPRMLSQSLRTLCLALLGLVGLRAIWKYYGTLERSTGESGRFACRLWNNWQFADICFYPCLPLFKLIRKVQSVFQSIITHIADSSSSSNGTHHPLSTADWWDHKSRSLEMEDV